MINSWSSVNKNRINVQLEYNFKKKKPISFYFKNIISSNKLKLAWYQLKRNLNSSISFTFEKNLSKVNENWFSFISKKLILSQFKYFSWKYMRVSQSKNQFKTKFTDITDLKTKIIEKAYLNFIKTIIKEAWQWRKINYKRYMKLKKNLSLFFSELKYSSTRYFVKHWFYRSTLHLISSKILSEKAPNRTLNFIKSWKKEIELVSSNNLLVMFNHLNFLRLKKILKCYVKCSLLWGEITKMWNAKILKLNFSIMDTESAYFNDVLSSFLLSLYLNELDTVIHWISFKKIFSRKKLTMYSKISLYYARHRNAFLIGIKKSLNFSVDSANKIYLLFQYYCYLNIKRIQYINWYYRSVFFLGFIIYISKCTKKFSQINYLSKYKERIHASLSKAEIKLSKAAVFHLKKSMIKAFRGELMRKNINFEKKNLSPVASQIVNELILKSGKKLNHNSLVKWEKNYLKLFKLNQSLGLEFYHKQISKLNICANDNFVYYFQLKALKHLFTKKVEKIKLNELKRKAGENNLFNGHFLKSISRKKEFSLKFKQIQQKKKFNLNAPSSNIVKKLILKGFLHSRSYKPISNLMFFNFNNVIIIQSYSNIINTLFNYYCFTDNFSSILDILIRLRKSCALTLATKHKKTIQWSYKVYTSKIRFFLNNQLFTLPYCEVLPKRCQKHTVWEQIKYTNLKSILKTYMFKL